MVSCVRIHGCTAQTNSPTVWGFDKDARPKGKPTFLIWSKAETTTFKHYDKLGYKEVLDICNYLNADLYKKVREFKREAVFTVQQLRNLWKMMKNPILMRKSKPAQTAPAVTLSGIFIFIIYANSLVGKLSFLGQKCAKQDHAGSHKKCYVKKQIRINPLHVMNTLFSSDISASWF